MRIYQINGTLLASTDSRLRLKSERMQADEVLTLLTDILDRSVSGYLVDNVGHARPLLGKMSGNLSAPGSMTTISNISIGSNLIKFTLDIGQKTFELRPVSINSPLVWQGQSSPQPDNDDDEGVFFMRVTVMPLEVTFFDFSKMVDALPLSHNPEATSIRRSLLVSTRLVNED